LLAAQKITKKSCHALTSAYASEWVKNYKEWQINYVYYSEHAGIGELPPPKKQKKK